MPALSRPAQRASAEEEIPPLPTQPCLIQARPSCPIPSPLSSLLGVMLQSHGAQVRTQAPQLSPKCHLAQHRDQVQAHQQR